MKAIIIDDERLARTELRKLLQEYPEIEIVDEASNADEGIQKIENHNPDLVFLDIQMPGMNGLELIKSLHNPPRIVLITAYREYAVEGFELDVLDYLVKPVSFERFLKTVSRYHHYSVNAHSHDPEPARDTFENAYMFFKVNKEMIQIFLRDILYIESIKDYIKIVTADKSYITYQRINYMEEKLPESNFVRVHKSYIVAVPKIKAFRSDTIKIGQVDIPVGRHYKKNFTEQLTRRNVS